jgi:hypothetical protein
MPPATKRYPLIAIASNIPHENVSQRSFKPHDCMVLKRCMANDPLSTLQITALNAKPMVQVGNGLDWTLNDSCRPQPSRHFGTAQILKPLGSEERICSQSLSSLIPALHDSKMRNRLRALQMICAIGRMVQCYDLEKSACCEERCKVDNHNLQADAALCSFELNGGCAAMIKLLNSGHEGLECGALMGLALLCTAGTTTLCARVCSEGGLTASILRKRPWGEKCTLSMLGLLLNCSSHKVCHSSFCDKEICFTLLSFLVPWQNEHDMKLANYACSAIANLCGGDSSIRNYLIFNYSHHLKSLFILAEKGCSPASLAIKNLCCCCSSLECAKLKITGNDLIQLLHHLLPLSADTAEHAASALQCYCLHSPLQSEQLSLLVKMLPHAGNLRSLLLATICNATLHRESPTVLTSALSNDAYFLCQSDVLNI